ncbi:uncharacterized protein LOC113213468 [Frankliniella occidentalis]|uniref:Uncharacterized protein LOC113213468 n=1 Tax=Frankliniella occidentalis TaxID=133901 RepID=A0A6J1T4V2_FRAOC|nr:uncharacterized protein LOC113213468 [Frankliniella occidentalis]
MAFLRVLCASLSVCLTFAAAASEQRAGPPTAVGEAQPHQLPPPPPPVVVFVNDRDIEGATRLPSSGDALATGAADGFERYGVPAGVPSSTESRTSRRGTLVARTTELSSHAVPQHQHISLVTAEGVRVRAEGLTLPFSSNVPPLPAGADRPTDGDLAAPSDRQQEVNPIPSSAPAPATAPTPAPTATAPPSYGHIRPPSPNTIVTYYSLGGGDAKVKMIPYLQLVERLVGKEAYGPPSTAAPPPPPTGAEVYGLPGTSTPSPPPPPRSHAIEYAPRSEVYGQPPLRARAVAYAPPGPTTLAPASAASQPSARQRLARASRDARRRDRGLSKSTENTR